MRKFLFPILLFDATVTAGHALTCVPKTGTAPSTPNYLQYWDNTYLQCGGNGGESFYKCAPNVVVEGWDGNLHKCTAKGWKIVSADNNIAVCGGELEEIEQRYDGVSNLGTLVANESSDSQWLYYYDTNEADGYTAIKNYCKYSYKDFETQLNECKNGDFLFWNNNDTVTLCKENTTTTQTTITTAPTLKQYRDIACRDTGGDRYDSKNDKCICNTDEKHLTTVPSEEGYSICQCIAGYHRNGTPDENGKYAATGECVDAGDYETHEEFDSAAWRKDTENAYKHERDNAQSWANKGVTAGSTLMTGEGAMMAAQAIAEKRADERAEREMAQYITTMKCEYGGGQQVNLGKEETLPFGELSKYYTEYKQLADKLKATKTALNLRPGIENEVLYEKAETGLYHYQTAETGGGGFTSVARALMNPGGADATAWNAQKAEVAQNLQTGTLLTAGGLVVGAAGNYLLNRNHKNEYMNLEKEFNEISRYLETEYPEIFTAPAPQQRQREESVSTPNPLPAQLEQSPIEELVTFELSNLTDTAFNRSKIDLTEEGETALKDEAVKLAEQLDKHPDIKIIIIATGHADPEGISSKTANDLTKRYKEIFSVDQLPNNYKNRKIGTNEDLALARAEVALKFLKDQLNSELQSRISTQALTRGDEDCPNGTLKENYNTCRYVAFEVVLDI